MWVSLSLLSLIQSCTQVPSPSIYLPGVGKERISHPASLFSHPLSVLEGIYVSIEQRVVAKHMSLPESVPTFFSLKIDHMFTLLEPLPSRPLQNISLSPPSLCAQPLALKLDPLLHLLQYFWLKNNPQIPSPSCCHISLLTFCQIPKKNRLSLISVYSPPTHLSPSQPTLVPALVSQKHLSLMPTFSPRLQNAKGVACIAPTWAPSTI